MLAKIGVEFWGFEVDTVAEKPNGRIMHSKKMGNALFRAVEFLHSTIEN